MSNGVTINPDTVYTQLYFEMRRYRDYELSVATWWTTMLLALLSGIIWGQGGSPGLLHELLQDVSVKGVLTGLVILLGIGILHALHYTNVRYNTLRASCDTNFSEPPFIEELRDLIRHGKAWTPLKSIVIIISALVSGIVFVLWYKTNPQVGIIFGGGWLLLALGYWFGCRSEQLRKPQ